VGLGVIHPDAWGMQREGATARWAIVNTWAQAAMCGIDRQVEPSEGNENQISLSNFQTTQVEIKSKK
jgi:hypothetical protein